MNLIEWYNNLPLLLRLYLPGCAIMIIAYPFALWVSYLMMDEIKRTDSNAMKKLNTVHRFFAVSVFLWPVTFWWGIIKFTKFLR